MSEHKVLTNIIKQAISHALEQEKREWPPGCAGFYYQPKRPCDKYQKTEKTNREYTCQNENF